MDTEDLAITDADRGCTIDSIIFVMSTVEYRVSLLGVIGAGKSAIALRFMGGRFVEFYQPNFQELYSKQCILDNEAVVLEVTPSVAGVVEQEQYPDYRDMREKEIRHGDGFLLVYSITSRSSFEAINRLHQEILYVKGVHTPIVIVGNKCDLEFERKVGIHEGRELASQLNCQAIEVSAKQGTNISEAFMLLAQEMREYRKERPPSEVPKPPATGFPGFRRSRQNSGSRSCVIF